jgi:uncharacterized protein (DUF1015 family)
MTDLPSSAVGVIRQFAVSKSGIEIFSKQVIEAVQSGEVNALELKATFKAIEKIIEKVDEATKENQVRAADKWMEKKFTAFGAEIEKAEVAVKYDYSICGDPVYDQRLKIFNEAKAQLDERQNFLKALSEPLRLVDEGSGEVALVHPPLKKSTSGLKFSFK